MNASTSQPVERVKLGTAVITCMGMHGVVRKQFRCDDGSYNYRIVPTPAYQMGTKWFPEWITRDSFRVV